MKNLFLVAISALVISSCTSISQNDSNEGRIDSAPSSGVQKTIGESHLNKKTILDFASYQPDTDLQISQYIRRIFQDSKGHLWFGTTQDGVVRYNGKSLWYFSKQEGLSGMCVKSIVEDHRGNIWVATENGVSKYDGTNITNFNAKDGLGGNDVWSLLVDNAGNIWVGGNGGVCRYDGQKFTPFALPAAAKDDDYRGVIGPKIIWSMIQDHVGNIWFASNGAGVFRYGGNTLTNFTEKDGLSDNFVRTIFEDKNGMIWMGTMHNGICRFDPTKTSPTVSIAFSKLTVNDGLCSNRVLYMYGDKSGNVWTAAGHCLDRYDGKTFTNFTAADGLTNTNVQCILEDNLGNHWIGTGEGLFRYNGKSFTPVSKIGPWL